MSGHAPIPVGRRAAPFVRHRQSGQDVRGGGPACPVQIRREVHGRCRENQLARSLGSRLGAQTALSSDRCRRANRLRSSAVGLLWARICACHGMSGKLTRVSEGLEQCGGPASSLPSLRDCRPRS